MRAFADLVRTHLNDAGLSQRRFAAAVGSTSAYISLVCAGKRNAPDLPAVEQWASVLGLGKKETEALLLSAALSRAAPMLVRYVEALERQGTRRDSRINRLTKPREMIRKKE